MTTLVENALINTRLMQMARDRDRAYLLDPVGFISSRLGSHLWSKQRETVESVRDHRHTAVHSCHSSGKSFVAARTVAWWLACHKPGEAFAVTTAPTFKQVKAILWREIHRAFRIGKLPGRLNQTEWLINEELVAFGNKPADWDPAAFQGIHAKAVLVVIDEAAGVPENIYEAVETITTSEYCRILAIGNPDDPSSKFASVCLPGSGWNVIHVDGYATPNFTGEEVPDELSELLIAPAWVDERRDEWGEDSPLFVSKIRGLFPEEGQDQVIPLSFIRKCQQRVDDEEGEADPGAPVELPEVELGVDVGAGGDETVIFERVGDRAGRHWRYRTPDWSDAVGKVVQAINETGATRVKVDVIGIGWGVVGRLKEVTRRVEIVPVNVGEASTNSSKWPKLRDEIWWAVGRELSRSQGWDLTNVDDSVVSQLIAPKYTLDSSGRVKVEPKEETKKRLGRSPDLADALLLAFFHKNTGKVSGRLAQSMWSDEPKVNGARGASRWRD
jgi:hypothetical protein